MVVVVVVVVLLYTHRRNLREQIENENKKGFQYFLNLFKFVETVKTIFFESIVCLLLHVLNNAQTQ